MANGISVIEPVGRAVERVRAILFAPFRLDHWIIIGFCAWLAELVGGWPHFNLNFQRHEKLPPVVMDFVHEHLRLLIVLGVIVAVIAVVVTIVLLWLSSRGRFMFLDCVARNRAHVVEPWRAYRSAANSLFWFRLIAGLIGLVVLFLIAALAGGLVYFVHGVHGPMLGVAIAGIVLLSLAVGLPALIFFAVVMKFTKDFVVPIMYLRGVGILAAWRQLLGLVCGHAGEFVLYLLFQIVLAMAIGLMVLAFMVGLCCCTCCIGTILFLLPYVGTVVLLPVLVFTRSYSLYYLRQFGAAYDAISG